MKSVKSILGLMFIVAAMSTTNASASSRVVGHINYANNPGTLTFQIPTQFASKVTVDTYYCPYVRLDYVQVYSAETLRPTRRFDDTSFSVNGGYGAYIFGLVVTTSGSGVCSLPVILED